MISKFLGEVEEPILSQKGLPKKEFGNGSNNPEIYCGDAESSPIAESIDTGAQAVDKETWSPSTA
jgi:hypothetical protein